jgi:hypothetical protein
VYVFDLDRYFYAFWDDSDFTAGDTTETVVVSPGVDQPPLVVGNLDLDEEFTDRPPLVAGDLDLDNESTFFLRCLDDPEPADWPPLAVGELDFFPDLDILEEIVGDATTNKKNALK